MEDMAKRGQLDPITTHDGLILDGRHRYRACLNLGLAPKVEAWSGQGGSPVAFVVSRNLHRRHLTASQRAAAALKLKDELAAEGKANMRAGGGDKKSSNGRAAGSGFSILRNPIQSEKQAAEMMGVSQGYVAEAEQIRKADVETFEEVASGTITIPQAKRKLKATDRELAPRKQRKAKPKPTQADDHTGNLTSLVFNPGDPRGNARVHSRYLGRDYWLEYIDEMAKLLI